jgi:chromosome partitioning protein
VWVTNPIEPPNDYQRGIEAAKILVLANLKGGVGKTTVAANIGAFLAKDDAWRKKVLLIDLDYQGSLSSMALPDDDRWLPPPGQDSIATRAISGDLEPAIFVSCAKETKQEPRLKVITAHYDLAQADNRLLVEWLIQCRRWTASNLRHALADLLYGKLFRTKDVRYNLADLLHSDAVRAAFDLVIIDCPPRLTTGMVQALCAGTHLLIPTILDLPSSEAVTRLIEQVETLKARQICPHLRYVGIVATKHREGLVASEVAERRLVDDLRERPR